jgi:hypothetical protein
LIRHANSGLAAPVLPLSVSVIEPAFGTSLVTAVGATLLLEPGFVTAGGTAIALSTIAVRADPEHCLATAAAANPLPENDFAMNLHASPQTGLDNGSRSWQVRTSFDAW